MTTTVVERVPKSYAVLREELRQVVEKGRAVARSLLERQKALTYWEFGRRVNTHLRVHRGRAGYGEYVVKQLEEDFGMSPRLIYEILNFQRLFPIVRARAQLEWTHFKLLSRVKDAQRRETLFREAVRKHWDTRQLAARIGRQELAPPEIWGEETLPESALSRPPRPLAPLRGNFYTYQILKPRDLHLGPEFYSVDLGFGTRIDLKLKGLARPREGQVIEALRTEKNPAGDRYRFRASPAGRETLYTYKATVEQVIDDDTLWTQVDLGFRVWTRQKLRLRGINAPEPADKRKMSRFVAETLARVSFVVVKLHSRDKFDRYLTDLFYKEGEPDAAKVLREGTYLNQELLDRDLAARV